MYDILFRGGPLVVPIAICSLLALTVFLERLWVLRRSRVIPDAFVNRIHEMIDERRVSDALLLCEENKNPMANIMEAALRNAQKERGHIKEMVEEVGKHEGAQLEQYIEVIGTCAAISPLMGAAMILMLLSVGLVFDDGGDLTGLCVAGLAAAERGGPGNHRLCGKLATHSRRRGSGG